MAENGHTRPFERSRRHLCMREGLTVGHDDGDRFLWHLVVPRCEAAVCMTTHELFAFMVPADRP